MSETMIVCSACGNAITGTKHTCRKCKEIFCSCYTKHHCEVTQPFIFAEVSAPKRQKKKTDNIPESDVVTSDRMSPATEHAIQVAAAKPDRDVAKSTISESQATDTPLEKEPEQTRAVNAQTGKPESLTAMAASASDRGVTVANLKPTTVTDSGLEAKSEPRTAVSKEQSDRDVAKSTISESKATGTPLEKEPEQTRAVNAQTGEPESLTAIAASASDRGVAKPTTVAEAESRAASSPVSKDPPKADKCEPAKKDSRIEVQQESEIAARGLSNPGRAKLDFNFETRSGRGLKEAFPGTIAEVFEHAILDEADEDSPNTLYAGMQCIGNDYIYLCTAQMAASDHDCGNQTACAHEYPNKAPVYQHLYLSKVDIDTFLRQSVIDQAKGKLVLVASPVLQYSSSMMNCFGLKPHDIESSALIERVYAAVKRQLLAQFMKTHELDASAGSDSKSRSRLGSLKDAEDEFVDNSSGDDNGYELELEQDKDVEANAHQPNMSNPGAGNARREVLNVENQRVSDTSNQGTSNDRTQAGSSFSTSGSSTYVSTAGRSSNRPSVAPQMYTQAQQEAQAKRRAERKREREEKAFQDEQTRLEQERKERAEAAQRDLVAKKAATEAAKRNRVTQGELQEREEQAAQEEQAKKTAAETARRSRATGASSSQSATVQNSGSNELMERLLKELVTRRQPEPSPMESQPWQQLIEIQKQQLLSQQEQLDLQQVQLTQLQKKPEPQFSDQFANIMGQFCSADNIFQAARLARQQNDSAVQLAELKAQRQQGAFSQTTTLTLNARQKAFDRNQIALDHQANYKLYGDANDLTFGDEDDE